MLLSKYALEIWRDNPKKTEELLGYSIDSEEIEGDLRRAFNIKIENMNNDPGNEKWYSYFAMIVDSRIIGSIGAKGKPDKDGSIEIGYGISPNYEGNGYTTEAVSMFCHYYFSNHLVKAIKACTDLSNTASQKVIIKIDSMIWELKMRTDDADRGIIVYGYKFRPVMSGAR